MGDAREAPEPPEPRLDQRDGAPRCVG